MQLLIENQHIVNMVPPTSTPAGLEQPVSMKDWDHATIIIQVDNATGVSGTAVTLTQGTAVGTTGAMTDDKSLEFDWVYVCADTAAGDTLTKTAVTSDTFTTSTTSNKNLLYVIEIEAADLDVENSFDCLRVDLTDPTSAVVSAACILSRGRYMGGTPKRTVITD